MDAPDAANYIEDDGGSDPDLELAGMRKLHEVNTLGRDFIIGDLHGCFMRLQQLLAHVQFDVHTDRLFSVGDLTDRGPRSVDCLRLLDHTWFYAVQGNHEQLMCGYFDNQPQALALWIPNGGDWGVPYKNGSHVDAREVRNLVRKAQTLPLLNTVKMRNGKHFHVLHAELNSIDPLTDDRLLNDGETFRSAALGDAHASDPIVWGRSLFQGLFTRHMTAEEVAAYEHGLHSKNLLSLFGPELSHIYSGHTIVTRPTTIAGQTDLDTGAFISYERKGNKYPVLWAGLTMVEPLTRTFWQASELGVVETTPLMIASQEAR